MTSSALYSTRMTSSPRTTTRRRVRKTHSKQRLRLKPASSSSTGGSSRGARRQPRFRVSRWGPLLAASAAWLAVGCSRPPAPVRIEITPDIIGIRAGASFAYLLRHGNEVALVDAGSDPEGAVILGALARWGLGPQEVSAVLLTHGHRDQSAAAVLFTNATVYVGAADHELIRGERRPEGIMPTLAAHLGPAPPLNQRLRSVIPRTLIEAAGRSFDAFAIPGHTRGSLVFSHAGILFTGDSLVLAGEEVDAGPALTSGNRDLNLETLLRLRGLAFTVVADGHHGVARDGGARFARWLDNRR